jgi:hypothetical protein
LALVQLKQASIQLRQASGGPFLLLAWTLRQTPGRGWRSCFAGLRRCGVFPLRTTPRLLFALAQVRPQLGSQPRLALLR